MRAAVKEKERLGENVRDDCFISDIRDISKIGVSFHPPVGVKVGDEGEEEKLPTEEHDIKLDWCITSYFSHWFV